MDRCARNPRQRGFDVPSLVWSERYTRWTWQVTPRRLASASSGEVARRREVDKVDVNPRSVTPLGSTWMTPREVRASA
jgi:hypothetical protein